MFERFPPSLSEAILDYLGFTIKSITQLDQLARTNLLAFVTLQGLLAFPLPILVKAFLPWPYLVLTSICLVLLYRITKSGLVLFFLLITPWFVQAAVLDITALLTLTLILGLVHVSKKWLQIGLIILLSFTSLAGLIFSCIFLMSKKHLGWIVLGIALVLTSGFLNAKQSTFLAEDDYSISRQETEVNIRVREETRLNDYRDIVPLRVKRIGYNKYFFAFRNVYTQAFKLWDWDKLTSPSQMGTTVAKSVWSEKHLPLFYFWELALVGIGLFGLKLIANPTKRLLALTILGAIISGFLTRSTLLNTNAILLVIPVVLLATQGFKMLAIHWPIRILMSIFILIAVVSFGHHFWKHQLVWRDNRPFVFSNTTKLMNQASLPLVTTTVIGPVQFYWAADQRISPASFWRSYTDVHVVDDVTFRHFDFSLEKPVPETYYIGFPGEFLGNRQEKKSNDFAIVELPAHLQLIDHFTFPDAVSFGNGNSIWLVKAKLP